MAGRIAYCVTPRAGGLFRFYRNLRSALAPHGWEVLAPVLGSYAAARWDPDFADQGCALIAEGESDRPRLARAFAAWTIQERIDIVIPMDDSIAASAVPHMPPEARLVTRCSNATSFGYRICAIHPQRLSRVIVMTPRLYDGLRRARRLRQEQLVIIPHGVDLRQFSSERRSDQADGARRLRIVYAGRLDDKTKGTLWLPSIIAELARAAVEFEFQIIGDGPDRSRLESLLRRKGIDGQCQLRGTMRSDQIARVFCESDVLLMPSRIDGFPNVLGEAMAAGSVPVASHIRGVTDFIVEHRVSGLLCRVGDTRAFAQAIAELASNRERLKAMSRAARRAVEERFSLERMGRDYDRVFRAVISEPPPDVAPRPWSEFREEPAFRSGWRGRVPRRVKDLVRRYMC